MADIITTGTSGYSAGAIDTASVLVNNVSPIDAKHPNGLAAAITQIESILGSGTSLKGTLATLVARLAVQMSPAGIVIPAGIIWPYGGSTPPTGSYLCDGSAKSRTTDANLFAAIGTTWGVGDGSTTFNVPKLFDVTLIGAGTRTVTESGTDTGVDTTTDTLLVLSNNTKWITGMSVLFSLTSGTITGLTSGNTYYIVRNNATTVKLASSLANAQNGTVVDMTAKSTPVWTITHTDTPRTLGELGGEEAHAQSLTELLAHTHTFAQATIGGGGSSGTGGNTPANIATSSSGGNTAMNIMQPFAVVNYIIWR